MQDHRLLRRIADPQAIGKVDVKKFCQNFETADLRHRRLSKILNKVASAFFLKGFNMRKAFALFDTNGDGYISAKEFRQALVTLNIRMRFDEIDDLIKMCDQNGDGKISYEEFVAKMDIDIRRRARDINEIVEEKFFERLGLAIDYSKESIHELMADYDFERDGTI